VQTTSYFGVALGLSTLCSDPKIAVYKVSILAWCLVDPRQPRPIGFVKDYFLQYRPGHGEFGPLSSRKLSLRKSSCLANVPRRRASRTPILSCGNQLPVDHAGQEVHLIDLQHR